MQKENFIQSKIEQHKIRTLTETKTGGTRGNRGNRGNPGEPGGTRGNRGKKQSTGEPGEPGEIRQKSVPQENIASSRGGTGGSAQLDLILKSFRLESLQAEPGLGNYTKTTKFY